MKYFFWFIIGLLVWVWVWFFGSYQWVLTSASESVAALLDEWMVLLNEDIDSSDVQWEAKRIFDEQKEKLVELVEKEKTEVSWWN